jgi:hypothetical protein
VDNNWIDSVMGEVSHVETPKSWLWWSLVSAISAGAGANYHLIALKGALVYKPNLYVMLLGGSGLGKGFGINLSKLIVQKADSTRVIAGRSSIQAIVSELSKQKTRPDGKTPIEDSRGFIVNGELSSAIIADVDSLAILTDLYDGQYNPEWTNLLKISGKEKLINPYITALFGSSPAHFYDTIPSANIEGGYIGRNLIVFEEVRAQNVDLLDENDDDVDDKLKNHVIPHYSKHLVKLNEMKGRLIPNNSAKGLFNEWRTKWRKSPQPDKTGFINRVPDHVLKVAMCIALSRYDLNGEIIESDIQLAIKKVEDLIYANRMTTAGRGIDPLAAQGRTIIELILAQPGFRIHRRALLALGHGNFDSIALDRIISSYEETGWIVKTRHNAGADSDYIYTLQGPPIEAYGRKIKNGNSS